MQRPLPEGALSSPFYRHWRSGLSPDSVAAKRRRRSAHAKAFFRRPQPFPRDLGASALARVGDGQGRRMLSTPRSVPGAPLHRPSCRTRAGAAPNLRLPRKAYVGLMLGTRQQSWAETDCHRQTRERGGAERSS